MGRPRHPAKKDNNHDEIAAAFRGLHWQWIDTFALGDGFPDGLVHKRGVVILIEVKNGDKATFTKAEKEFRQKYEGEYRVVRTVGEVMDIEREFFG